MSSFLFLTQTFLDKDKLQRLLAWQFFHSSLYKDLEEEIDLEAAENLWQKKEQQSLILRANFPDKEKFTEQVLHYWRNYAQPTLLFLGDLNDYSEQLQEGMLKLLEEPPANLTCLLFAQHQAQVLPTILSRTRTRLLPRKLILANLDQTLLEKTKKVFPPAGDFAKNWLKNGTFDLSTPKDFEREELDFWLWQVETCLAEIFKQRPEKSLANLLQKTLEARKLNSQNVQKKLALGWLQTV